MTDRDVPPLTFDASDDLFAVPSKRPATRRNDHATSVAAANKAAATQGTIRATVLQFAEDAGPAGFIDDDLVKKFAGDGPESSWRKRRGELTEEGHLVSAGPGRTRTNQFGNQEQVWFHRMFASSPPPLIDRPAPAPKSAPSDLKAKGKDTAQSMLEWSASMRKEGRMMFATALKDAAEVMRLLSN